MITIIIIYIISWSIILLAFLYGKLFKGSSLSPKGDPWYLWFFIIFLTPLVIVIAAYFIMKQAIINHQEKEYMDKMSSLAEVAETVNNMFIEDYESSEKKGIPSNQISIAKELQNLAKNQTYGDILTILNRLHLPNDCSLMVKEAEFKGHGDVSKLFISKVGTEDSEKIYDELFVEDSVDGAFQVFLLYNLWHYLPFFWHGGYNEREYVYSNNDFSDFDKYFIKEDMHIVDELKKIDITPRISRSDNIYYISCCYWSQFGGLTREVIGIDIADNKVKNIFNVKEDTLYEYESGVRF